METPEETNSNYPTGYTDIGQRVNATIQRVRSIDRQIENVPADSKPAPILHPPGYSAPYKPPGQRERMLIHLKSEREQTLTDAWRQVEKETPVAKDKEAGVARDKAREALFPNPYRHLSKEGLNAERSQSRDLEKAQDYMDAVRSNQAAERTMAPQQEQPVPAEDKEDKPLTLSDRYTQKLGRHIEQGRDMTKPGPTPTVE